MSEPRGRDTDLDLFLDFDLLILAAPPAQYAAYAAQIRTEYQHVPEALFCTGRAAVLASLGDVPAIFRTPAIRAAYETQARANLERESAELQKRAAALARL
eukprot:TRINITY_DN700_c0_g1_i1.p5 TRINITY_DN700_c0_g1~~TRINITY_DN700_c0_g1_i1.p5  ORF type:complete len:101 (-),score=31.06 TRINITY_DN700_c0_g1_i1:59-361(-)